MRKFLIFCLSLVSVIALALGTTGCMVGDWFNQTFCEHEFNDGEEIKAPTCSEVGVLAKTCNLCGYVEESDIEMLEHTIVKIDKVEPTCTEEGLSSYSKCRVCDYVYVAPIVAPALGHTEVIDEEIPATCIEDGLSEGSHCSVCEAVIVTREKILPTGHTLVYKPAVPATCISKGLTQGAECATCGEVYTVQEEIPLADHIYEDGSCRECGYVEYIGDDSSLYTLEVVEDGDTFTGGWYRIELSDPSVNYGNFMVFSNGVELVSYNGLGISIVSQSQNCRIVEGTFEERKFDGYFDVYLSEDLKVEYTYGSSASIIQKTFADLTHTIYDNSSFLVSKIVAV